MKRRYTAADYRRTVALIRANVPDAAITTDVIVGFPGETDAEFKETLDFCREMQIRPHPCFPLFPPPRHGGGDDARSRSPPRSRKSARSRCWRWLKKARGIFSSRFLGKTMEVLWEKESGGVWSGLTGNYIKVYIKSKENLTNTNNAGKAGKNLPGRGVGGD